MKKKSSYTYLALGDSYTIGEQVDSKLNFPNQVVQLLRQKGIDIKSPKIIAKTGWTTFELTEEIKKTELHPPYDFVTLLIGVNNQYQGRTVEDYKPEFESLLKQAIGFAGDNRDHVIVLSIPDWGVTPFAKDRDGEKITKEIDQYNAANKQIALQYNVHYIDITPGTRMAGKDSSLVTTDGLHPSGKEYAIWTEKVAAIMQLSLEKKIN